MAAPRTTQFLALRNLARQANAPRQQQIRTLHMTGPATYASPVLTQERSILYLPRDIASLRAECKRQHIDASGSEQEMTARLNAEHIAHHRSFSSLSTSRPTNSTTSTSPRTKRHFNTSRALKAVNDSSTIDFAYMPWSAADHDDTFSSSISSSSFPQPMPVLPTNLSSSARVVAAAQPVMKPEISTTSADTGRVSVLAESVDCHGLHVDFQREAERSVGRSSGGVKAEGRSDAGSEGGVLRTIWKGVVDDLTAFGGGGRKVGFA